MKAAGAAVGASRTPWSITKVHQLSYERQEPVGFAADPSDFAARDISFLRGSSPEETRAGPWLRGGALLAFLACAGVNAALVLQRGGGGAEAAGAVVGSFIWPMLLAGAYSLWSSRPTQRGRFKVFLFTCLALLLLPTLTYVGVRGYAHYVVQANAERLSFDELDERAQECWRHGDAECVESLWRRYAATHPQDGAGRFRLGVALSRLNRYGEATAEFERALELGEGAPQLFAYYADSLAKSGRTDEAIDWSYKTLSVAPTLVDVRGQLAKLLVSRKRHYEALSLLQAFDAAREAKGRPGYFAAQRLGIESLLEREAPTDTAEQPVLRLPIHAGHYFAPLSLGRSRPKPFMVDTGATTTTFSTADLEAADVVWRVSRPRVEMRTADGRKVTADAVVLESVRLGPFELKNVAAVVCEDCASLLGQSTLSRFDMASSRKQGVEFLSLTLR
ncbi:retroviral-like aspartic protease family protein [Aquabacterium sp. A7-Y]|uniref:retroviral-like aspartic protease family protein n=1 Tax=Aquabacterium sp. A7-Y TaxID=1349605 RepID=UPI00223D0107|nr:retroviral-like aspartic protease family protein [Aquabacterium sp. A7-Y]MCW7540457.1 retroviral-like aspartic protease family protein [Aquabacterium sp. A7-Y]